MTPSIRTTKDMFKYARTHYLKLNQRNMSILLGKGQSVYAKYETGDAIPPSQILIHLMNHISNLYGQEAVNDVLYQTKNDNGVDQEILELQTTLLKFKGETHKQTREHIKFMLNSIVANLEHDN